MAARKLSAAKQAEAEAKRGAILEGLSDGIDALCESAEWQRYLDVQARFRRYSFSNTMLIVTQRPTATQVASFKAWQGMGRQVRKGETAVRIWAPIGGRPRAAEDQAAEEERDGAEPKAAEPKASTKGYASRFTLVPVFDISQTDGEALPEPVKLLDGQAEAGTFGGLVKVAESIGYTVQVTPEIDGHEGANGLCEFGHRRLTVAGNRSPLQQVKSLTHEIAHALLHEPEGESETPTFKQPRGLRELEAESTAYVVCQGLGLDTSGYSFGYVAGWSGGDRKAAREAIKASGMRISGAAKQITEGLEAQAQTEHGEPEAQPAPAAEREIEAA
jgi:hypothetical protein